MLKQTAILPTSIQRSKTANRLNTTNALHKIINANGTNYSDASSRPSLQSLIFTKGGGVGWWRKRPQLRHNVFRAVETSVCIYNIYIDIVVVFTLKFIIALQYHWNMQHCAICRTFCSFWIGIHYMKTFKIMNKISMLLYIVAPYLRPTNGWD